MVSGQDTDSLCGGTGNFKNMTEGKFKPKKRCTECFVTKLEIKVESNRSYCMSGKICSIQAVVGQFKTQARAFIHMHFNTQSHIIHSQTEIVSVNVNYKMILSNHYYSTMISIKT